MAGGWLREAKHLTSLQLARCRRSDRRDHPCSTHLRQAKHHLLGLSASHRMRVTWRVAARHAPLAATAHRASEIYIVEAACLAIGTTGKPDRTVAWRATDVAGPAWLDGSAVHRAAHGRVSVHVGVRAGQ